MNFLMSPRDLKTANKFQIPTPLLQRGLGTIDASKTEVVVPTTRNRESVCTYSPEEAEGISSACNVEPVRGPEVCGEASKSQDPKIAIAISKVRRQKLM